MSPPAAPTLLDVAALRAWPLPALAEDADKEARGRILVVAGSREIPGAAVLAATAALRVGAGKLVVGTAASVASPMGFALPEARVIALPELRGGGMAPGAADLLAEVASSAQAVVIGPGLVDEDATGDLVQALLPALAGRPVLLDACAMGVVRAMGRLPWPALLTPHAGEMAHLCGGTKDAVQDDPARAAREAAARWNAVVVLKGCNTFIACPDGRSWQYQGGQVGLATSGSGDTLAGAIGGLCARGATLEQAAAWGVVLHAHAGDRLARQRGVVGYLARELPQEMSSALQAVQDPAHTAAASVPQLQA